MATEVAAMCDAAEAATEAGASATGAFVAARAGSSVFVEEVRAWIATVVEGAAGAAAGVSGTTTTGVELELDAPVVDVVMVM